MHPFRFRYAKPVYGGAVAFLGALSTAMLEVKDAGVVVEAAGVVTANEWVTTLLATIIAVGAVFGVTGTEPKKGGVPPADPPVTPPA